jgi:hypothetical protein
MIDGKFAGLPSRCRKCGKQGQRVGTRYHAAMEESTESLRRQLLAARDKVRQQIDKLHARPYPLAGVGPVGTVMQGFGAPFRTNGVMIDNDELIAKLTAMLSDIDDSLAELGDGPRE